MAGEAGGWLRICLALQGGKEGGGQGEGGQSELGRVEELSFGRVKGKGMGRQKVTQAGEETKSVLTAGPTVQGQWQGTSGAQYRFLSTGRQG